MTLEDIHNVINMVVKDDANAPDVSLEEFNDIIKAVNIEMFWDKYNSTESYSRKSGIPLAEVIEDSRDLRIFKNSDTVVLTTGAGTTPTGFVKYLGAGVTHDSQLREVELISNGELRRRQQNLMSKNIRYYPVMTINGTTVNVYPTDTSDPTLEYLKIPTAPEYAVKQENGVNIFDDANDTALEWEESAHPEFIKRCLNYLGVKISMERLGTYMDNVNTKSDDIT